MKRIITLFSVLTIWTLTGCNETADPQQPTPAKLIRIDFESGHETSSIHFEYENDLLVKKTDGGTVYRYSYENGALRTVHLNLTEADIVIRSEYRLEGDKLVIDQYANVNNYLGNFIDTDGLMLQGTTKRYLTGSNEIREDGYSYYQGTQRLVGYSIHTIENGNVHKSESVQITGGNYQTHEWSFLEEVKNPEHFTAYGNGEFVDINANIIKAYKPHGGDFDGADRISYELNEQGYPTVIRSEYVNPSSGDVDVATAKYIYE